MKMVFRKINREDAGAKRFVMGAATAAFDDNKLDLHTQTTIKLIYFIFHTLDRNMITALEKTLGVSAPHRRNVRRLVAKVSEQRSVLGDILKPVVRKSHSERYRIFQSVCKTVSVSQKYDMDFIRRIVRVGKELGLSEDEIYRTVENHKLAV